MNPLIRLIIAAALGVAWFVMTRRYAPDAKVSKEDPAGNLRRREILGALRALAFFCLLWFIISTVVLFVFGLAITLIAPPNTRGFGDAFIEVVNSASNGSGPLNPLSLWGALASLVATVAAVWIAQRVARGQSILDLGLRPYREMPVDIVLGLLLGPLIFALVYQAQVWLGYILGVNGPAYNWWDLAQWLLIFACIAVSEELVVRGYFMQTINQVWGGTAAVISTSLLWAFAHILNPRASLLGILDIVVAGLLFAYAYYITGRIWLPIFLHFSWNFAEGSIFGFPVSGYTTTNPVFQPFVNGPQEMTGGLFGPEGGLVVLPGILLGWLVLYAWDRSRRPSQSSKNETTGE